MSGTPTTARNAAYVFTIVMTDSSVPARTITKTYQLFVRGVVADFVEATPCDSVDLESNSDAVSIAVKDTFAYDKSIIDLSNKEEPIRNLPVLLSRTLDTCDQSWRKDDYLIIHLVKWPARGPSPGTPAKYDDEQDNWFLYKHLGSQQWQLQTVQGGTRIFGHQRVAVLLLHLSARDTWDIKYDVTSKRKLPAPIQNLIDLAGIILTPSLVADEAPKPPPNLWGGRLLIVKDLPADMTVAGNVAFVTDGLESSGQAQQPKTYSKVYDNEGRYHWDVSVGMPVKSFKEVQYDVEGSQVTAKEINRQNAYGFLNIFPVPVDTKGAEFYKTPHLVLGVPISGKPLDRPMVGLGLGFYRSSFKFNVFAGAVFNRVREPQTLSAGQAATGAELESDLRTKRVTKFIFGFNVPVGQFIKALKPKP